MRQELRLEQRQIITPQLLLNLKLLVLPNLELETLVRNELEQNPALELVTENPEETEKETEIPTEPTLEQQPEKNKEEFDVSDFMSDDVYSMPPEQDSAFDASEITTNPKSSLEDTLLPIVIQHIDEEDATIAKYIIGNLDEDGFLLMPVEEIAQTFHKTPAQVQEIINTVQHIEPGGIGSKNLHEALLFQLEILGYDENSLEVKIIRDYNDLLFKRHYSKIAKALSISENEVSLAILNLKNLDPRPARRYLFKITEYINPDFIIQWQDDNLRANLNDETFPVLRISPRYREILLSPKQFTPEEVNFARNKLQNAVNLVKAIEARKLLLRRIIDFIINNQKEFFINGKEFIKPIPIKTASESLGIHISTLSRACSGKYVETPVGIYPLKYFFTTGIGEYSRHSLKEKIQNIIKQEDKTKPLTDEEIVLLLKEQNIHLSRRTAAKYREELNISGSNDRIQK